MQRTLAESHKASRGRSIDVRNPVHLFPEASGNIVLNDEGDDSRLALQLIRSHANASDCVCCHDKSSFFSPRTLLINIYQSGHLIRWLPLLPHSLLRGVWKAVGRDVQLADNPRAVPTRDASSISARHTASAWWSCVDAKKKKTFCMAGQGGGNAERLQHRRKLGFHTRRAALRTVCLSGGNAIAFLLMPRQRMEICRCHKQKGCTWIERVNSPVMPRWCSSNVTAFHIKMLWEQPRAQL